MRRWLGLLVLLAAGALWLDRSPRVLPPGGPEGEDVVPYRDSGHPILLLLDPATLAEPAADVASRTPDLEWQNLLSQAVGGCDILRTSRVLEQPSLLEGRQWIVLPRVAMDGLDVALLAPLAKAVASGSVVWLEAPPEPWAQQLGMLHDGVEDRSHLGWPVADGGFRLDGPVLPPPGEALPFPHRVTRYRPQRGAVASARPVHSPAGRPMVWAAEQGRGAWRVLALHLAELSLAMRQGLPDPDFSVSDRHRDLLPGPVETNDLVVIPELLQTDHPWLDAWVDALLAEPLAPTPTPTLWPAPFAADGWLLVSHDDEGYGDKSAWMLREEAAWGLPSTLFLMPSDGRLTSDGFATLVEGEVALGLHPRLPSPPMVADPRSPRERLGIWKWQPLIRLPHLGKQRKSLEQTIGEAWDTGLNRNHFLLWTAGDVDQAWRWLTGLRMRADSSYGPDWGAAGWLFGSAVPFRPLSRRGAEHPIWEVPFHSAETIGEVDRSRVRRWLHQNGEGGHGPVHLLFHPDAFGWAPDAELFRLWEALPALAAETNHVPATLPALLDHWEARARTHVRWQRTAPGVLEIEVTGPEDGPRDLAIAVPTRWDGAGLGRWSTSPTTATRRAWSFGRPVRLFAVGPGTSRLTLIYSP